MICPLIFAYAKTEGLQASNHLIKTNVLIFPVFSSLCWFQKRGNSKISENFLI